LTGALQQRVYRRILDEYRRQQPDGQGVSGQRVPEPAVTTRTSLLIDDLDK